jgi:hypothetical protein
MQVGVGSKLNESSGRNVVVDMILAASLFLGCAAFPKMISRLRRRVENGFRSALRNNSQNIHSEPSYNASLIQLCVPQYGKEGMSLAFSNDLIIAKAIKGEYGCFSH